MSIIGKLIIRPLIKREIKKMVTEELFGLRPTTWLGVIGLVIIMVAGITGNLPDWWDKWLTLFGMMFGKTAIVEGLKSFKKNDHAKE